MSNALRWRGARTVGENGIRCGTAAGPSPGGADRGTVTLIPRREWIVEDPSVGLLPLVSWHGGLSDWEMLIPLIWKVI